MFRLLPWSSAIGGSQVMADEIKTLAARQPCAASGFQGLALPCLKRKRSDSSSSATRPNPPVATKLRKDETDTARLRTTQNTPLDDAPEPRMRGATTSPDKASDIRHGPLRSQPHDSQDSEHTVNWTSGQSSTLLRRVDTGKLRETLDAQLSLEILLKHNELRLIDQEIAKCQVALEQLRRCAEIPYPMSIVAGLSQDLSNDWGRPLLAPGNRPPPISPAPWGVKDGPYSRHYAKWLLPDPRFDGGESEPLIVGGTGLSLVEGRTTRGNSGDVGYGAGKSRLQRGSGGAKFQSLPSGYPPPRDKAGPMIIRRKSDGVLVKLVCLDCRRDNFSSAQGFINHCRIAHNRNFSSHDAAAVASGEPVEVDEAGAVVGARKESNASVSASFVHPLIRSAHGIEDSTVALNPSAETATDWLPSAADPGTTGQGPRQTLNLSHCRNRLRAPEIPGSSDSAFTASSDAPHLSSLVQHRGIGLNLSQLVGDAKTVVDIDAYSSGEQSGGESNDPPTTHERVCGNNRCSRQPMRTQVSSQRPPSQKGSAKATYKPLFLETLTPAHSVPYTSPYGPPPSDDVRDVENFDHSVNLSPNTIESNQAPSLVSDAGDDYGDASDADSPNSSASETGDDDQEFDHVLVEDDDCATNSTPKTDHHLAGSNSSHAGALLKPLRRSSDRKKHTFIPAPLLPLDRKTVKHAGRTRPGLRSGRKSTLRSQGARQ